MHLGSRLAAAPWRAACGGASRRVPGRSSREGRDQEWADLSTQAGATRCDPTWPLASSFDGHPSRKAPSPRCLKESVKSAGDTAETPIVGKVTVSVMSCSRPRRHARPSGAVAECGEPCVVQAAVRDGVIGVRTNGPISELVRCARWPRSFADHIGQTDARARVAFPPVRVAGVVTPAVAVRVVPVLLHGTGTVSWAAKNADDAAPCRLVVVPGRTPRHHHIAGCRGALAAYPLGSVTAASRRSMIESGT